MVMVFLTDKNENVSAGLSRTRWIVFLNQNFILMHKTSQTAF